MFFKETCFFFLKGLEKDTFQGQTVKWQQRKAEKKEKWWWARKVSRRVTSGGISPNTGEQQTCSWQPKLR